MAWTEDPTSPILFSENIYMIKKECVKQSAIKSYLDIIRFRIAENSARLSFVLGKYITLKFLINNLVL